MRKLTDDELQELLSTGPISDDSPLGEKQAADLLAYKELFEALDTPPAQGLPFSFASNARQALQRRLNRKSDIRFNVVAAILFIVCLVSGYGLLHLISKATADLVMNAVLTFKWVLLSAIFVFFAVLLLDQFWSKREY